MASYVQKLTYSFSQFGISLLWQAFNTVAIFYYVTELHVSGEILSLGMMLFGVVSGFSNLIFGHLSDRANTRWGRRIPYLLFASLPFAVLFYLLFNPLVSHHYLLYFFWVTFLFDLAFTITALNFGALYPEMYPTDADRHNVSALLQLFSILGAMVGVALAKPIGQTWGWGAMGLMFSITGAFSLYASLFGVHENPLYPKEHFYLKESLIKTVKNRNFLIYILVNLLIQLVTNLFVMLSSFYTKYAVPLSAGQSSMFLGALFLVTIPMSFVWAKVSVHKNTARTVMLSAVLYGLCALLFLVDNGPVGVILTGALLGIPVAGFFVQLNVMLAQIIEFDASQTGLRREGMYLGVNGFIVRLGMSLQFVMLTFYFSVSHFTSLRANQPVSAISDLRMMMGGLPVLLLSFAIWLLTKLK